jgi:hypothetical protein
MNSPHIRHFEVRSADSAATVQEMKDEVAAETKEKLEATGAKDIRFTFRQLNRVPSGLVMNVQWEMQADFTPAGQ